MQIRVTNFELGIKTNIRDQVKFIILSRNSKEAFAIFDYMHFHYFHPVGVYLIDDELEVVPCCFYRA